MSTNCIRCVKNKRTGPDLLCDECRVPSGKPMTQEQALAFEAEVRRASTAVMCPRCMPPGDPCCPYCNGTYSVEAAEQAKGGEA